MKLKRINLILFLLGGLLQGQASWSPAASLPEPRAGHASVVVDSLIFVIGGSSSGQHHGTGTVWSYNPSSDSWNTAYPDLHHERSNHVAIAIGDTIWVFGGQHTNTMVAAVERYIPGSTEWEVVGNMPVPRMGMGIARLGNQIYLFGGKTSNGMFALPTNRVDRYQFQDGSWSDGPPMLQGRSNFGYAANGDTIIVAGGSYLDPLLNAERYISGQGWTALTDLDAGRSNTAAVYIQNRYILLGGFSTGGQNMSNLELSNDQWIEFPGMGLPRYNHSAVVYNNTIYVMGGRNGQQTLASHEQYSLTLSLTTDRVFPVDYGITRPYPNPFNGTVQFDLILPPSWHGGDGYILINDLRGREVGRKPLTGARNGDRVRIDFSTLNSPVSSGIFFLTVYYPTEKGLLKTNPQRIIYLK